MSKFIQNLWDSVAEFLGYHLTSFSDLPPILADRYHSAQCVCEEMFGHVEDYTSLSPKVDPFIEAFFIAKDRTGAKATEAGWAVLPESFMIGTYPVRWEELGGIFVFPLQSSTSARAAVCVAVPKTMDPDKGWPRVYPSRPNANDGTEFFVLGRYGDMTEANEAIDGLRKAIRTLHAAAAEDARRRDRFGDDGQPDGAAF